LKCRIKEEEEDTGAVDFIRKEVFYMPGFNGTGPAGMGPMTGGGRGYCNSTGAVYGPAPAWGPGHSGVGYGRGFGRVRGFSGGYRPGFYRGFRPGVGGGRSYGRGIGQRRFYPARGGW